MVKHRPLIEWFNENFAKKNLIKQKYYNIVDKAFINRCEGDYKPFVTFTKKKVLKMFEKMKDFMSELEKYILQNEK